MVASKKKGAYFSRSKIQLRHPPYCDETVAIKGTNSNYKWFSYSAEFSNSFESLLTMNNFITNFLNFHDSCAPIFFLNPLKLLGGRLQGVMIVY